MVLATITPAFRRLLPAILTCMLVLSSFTSVYLQGEAIDQRCQALSERCRAVQAHFTHLQGTSHLLTACWHQHQPVLRLLSAWCVLQVMPAGQSSIQHLRME